MGPLFLSCSCRRLSWSEPDRTVLSSRDVRRQHTVVKLPSYAFTWHKKDHFLTSIGVYNLAFFAGPSFSFTLVYPSFWSFLSSRSNFTVCVPFFLKDKGSLLISFFLFFCLLWLLYLLSDAAVFDFLFFFTIVCHSWGCQEDFDDLTFIFCRIFLDFLQDDFASFFSFGVIIDCFRLSGHERECNCSPRYILLLSFSLYHHQTSFHSSFPMSSPFAISVRTVIRTFVSSHFSLSLWRNIHPEFYESSHDTDVWLTIHKIIPLLRHFIFFSSLYDHQ